MKKEIEEFYSKIKAMNEYYKTRYKDIRYI